MSELEKLMIDINKLRENLYRVIEQRGYDLNDPEVMEASKHLNKIIVNYNTMLKDKII
jgi:hypothetical protein